MVFPSLSRTGTHRICTTRNTQRPGRSTTAVPGGGELLQCVPTMRSAVDGVPSTGLGRVMRRTRQRGLTVLVLYPLLASEACGVPAARNPR